MATVEENLEELAICARVLAAHGHEDLTLGHVGWRDPDGRGVWLKRSGIGLSEVTGSGDFVLVGWDGETLAGDGKRHAEWPLHTEPLLARPDMNFSAHSHPEWATLLTAVDEPLPDFGQDAIRANALGMTRFEANADLVTDRAEGTAFASALGQARIALIRNHGLSFFADSVAMLALTGIYVERAAKGFLRLKAAGMPIRSVSPQAVPKVIGATDSPAFVADTWLHLKRMARIA